MWEGGGWGGWRGRGEEEEEVMERPPGTDNVLQPLLWAKSQATGKLALVLHGIQSLRHHNGIFRMKFNFKFNSFVIILLPILFSLS